MAHKTIGYGGYAIAQLTEDCGPGYPLGSWVAFIPGDYTPEFSASTEARLKAKIDTYQPQPDPWELKYQRSRQTVAA